MILFSKKQGTDHISSTTSTSQKKTQMKPKQLAPLEEENTFLIYHGFRFQLLVFVSAFFFKQSCNPQQPSQNHTLPKTNIALKRWWFPIGTSFSRGLFSGAMLVSGRVITNRSSRSINTKTQVFANRCQEANPSPALTWRNRQQKVATWEWYSWWKKSGKPPGMYKTL